LLIFLFVWALSNQVECQVLTFKGYITYNIKENDANGKSKLALVSKERYYFSNNAIIAKVLDGPQLFVLGKIDVYLDAERGLRYSIDYDNKLIENAPAPSDPQIIKPIEERLVGEGEILGQMCEIHFLKYVQYLPVPPYGGTRADTVSCTYYNSKFYQVAFIKQFCYLQGNRNSYFLDGRYQGIPLKIIRKKGDGSEIILECEEVKEIDVSEFVKLPNYPIKN
jgi:hypothetical protein